MHFKSVPALLRPLLAGVLLLGLTLPAEALQTGDVAPALSLPGQDGKTVSLADFKGHVVYLDFWASWCGPCKQSFPWLNDLQARYGVLGLKVLAVNVDAKHADAEGFLAQFPNNLLTVAFDHQGAAPAQYQIKGMPTSFLIGPDGKVLLVHQSFKESDREDLQRSIVAALDQAAKQKAGVQP
jgi:thiol-disulfide isomerase/thioredoxin